MEENTKPIAVRTAEFVRETKKYRLYRYQDPEGDVFMSIYLPKAVSDGVQRIDVAIHEEK